mmetsp:Transcript_22111/g.71381  ORF Transcript_22111/g.71381 Transcript_22111/m.71381 type:complete len:260 (-) Transcript_22111:1613-2392(-)
MTTHGIALAPHSTRLFPGLSPGRLCKAPAHTAGSHPTPPPAPAACGAWPLTPTPHPRPASADRTASMWVKVGKVRRRSRSSSSRSNSISCVCILTSECSLVFMCTSSKRLALSSTAPLLLDWTAWIISRWLTDPSSCSICPPSESISAFLSATSLATLRCCRRRSARRSECVACTCSSLRSSFSVSSACDSSEPPRMTSCRSLVTRRSWKSRVFSTRSSVSICTRSASHSSWTMPRRKSRISSSRPTLSPPSRLMSALS